METKRLELQVPDFVSIQQYVDMNSYTGTSAFGKLVHSVATLTGYTKEEVRDWDISSLTKVSNIYAELADHKEEFHSLIEWNGTLYGYANVKQCSLGEWVDLENLAQDMESNLHKIAAILYRPVEKHNFNSIEFGVKQKIKMVKNDVENVFDWYTIEKYDSKKRKEREESFKEFPVHIFLGALSFFLSTASLYLSHIAYLKGEITEETMNLATKEILRSLSDSTGAGGGLFTTSLSPIFYRLQGMSESPMSTLSQS